MKSLKPLSLLLAVVLLLGVAAAGCRPKPIDTSEPTAASENISAERTSEATEPETPPMPKSDFLYEEIDGELTITGYTGTDRELVVPAKIGYMNVRSIADEAFMDNIFIESVELSEGLLEIGSYAFFGCAKLSFVSIPDSVRKIGNTAFGFTEIWNNADDIVYVGRWITGIKRIPSTMIMTGDTVGIADEALAYVFFGGSITLPSGIKYIGNKAFYSALDGTLKIPASVAEIGAGAFAFCDRLSSIEVEANNSVYKSVDGVLFSLDGKILHSYPAGRAGSTYAIPNSVAEIGASAFISSKLVEVTIPSGVSEIGIGAFSNCIYLTELKIPSEVTKINDNTFTSCVTLKNVEIPSGVTEIGNYAFQNCIAMPRCVLPSALTRIGDWTFSYCSALTLITIPSGAIYIGDMAFYGSGLTRVAVPASVTNIGDGAFSGCRALKNIAVDTQSLNFKSIDGSLFSRDGKTLYSYSAGMVSSGYTIPDGVTAVAPYAFADSQKLKTVTVSEGVESVGKCAFFNCSALESVRLPNSLTAIQEAVFEFCTALESIVIPNGVASIEFLAFYGCSALKNAALPDDLTSIANSVFAMCASLENITIPNDVDIIGRNAFYGCISLTIYCRASAAPEGWHDAWNSDDRPVVWGYDE